MIRLSRALVRKPGVAEHQFGHLLECFMRSFAADPLVKRYVRSFVALGASTARLPGQPPRNYDALLDLWFDDGASLVAFLNDPAYAASLGAEERTLFDTAACNDVVTNDYPPIFGGGLLRPGFYSDTKLRFATLMVRNEAFAFDDFVKHHRSFHVPLFTSVPAIVRHVDRYVVSHRIDVPGLPKPKKRYDGVVDFFFEDVVAMGAVFANLEYLSKVRPDEHRFLNLSACDFLIGREIDVE